MEEECWKETKIIYICTSIFQKRKVKRQGEVLEEEEGDDEVAG